MSHTGYGVPNNVFLSPQGLGQAWQGQWPVAVMGEHAAAPAAPTAPTAAASWDGILRRSYNAAEMGAPQSIVWHYQPTSSWAGGGAAPPPSELAATTDDDEEEEDDDDEEAAATATVATAAVESVASRTSRELLAACLPSADDGGLQQRVSQLRAALTTAEKRVEGSTQEVRPPLDSTPRAAAGAVEAAVASLLPHVPRVLGGRRELALSSPTHPTPHTHTSFSAGVDVVWHCGNAGTLAVEQAAGERARRGQPARACVRPGARVPGASPQTHTFSSPCWFLLRLACRLASRSIVANEPPGMLFFVYGSCPVCRRRAARASTAAPPPPHRRAARWSSRAGSSWRRPWRR
jgi:hypothetical protein